jgi:uncharacterized membrane protein YdjX (TVP38/TMEM64 family)
VDPERERQEPTTSIRRNLLRGILALASIAVLVVLFRTLGVNERLRQLLDAIRGLGPFGPVSLVALYILACLLFVPGSVLTLGAGFVYGVLEGYAYVAVGSVLGATAAFAVGRTLARERIERKLADSPRFRAIDEAITREGWKIVLLTRLSPVFPFNLQNYMYGITGVSTRDYVLASWIGMIPGTLLYVYLGSAAGSLAQAASGEAGDARWKTILFGVGLLATIVVTIYGTSLARSALRDAIESRDEPKGGGPDADSRTP